MAKSKDATASAAKEAKAKAPADPVTTRNLVRLLNILALLLVITAFVLQFFAVVTHHWKYQKTDLQPILAPPDRPAQAHVSDDSQAVQYYGLFSRHAKVYSNNDEQLNAWTSTRFPRLDNGDGDLHQCLSQSSTLRSALLTCSQPLKSPGTCHCRRYPHWNAIIFFEIAALILLGLAVFASALLSTQYEALLKLIGAALAAVAFLFLLIGLILILSYLKRETRTLADTYPHTYSRIADLLRPRYQTALHKAVRRQAHETYRSYSLGPGQAPYNLTHFQQYQESTGQWIHLPYTSLAGTAYVPRQGATQPTTTALPLRNAYGPLVAYDHVYKHTHASISWSTVLSIIALILSLLVAGLLAFSWLTGKKLAPEGGKTVTTTTTIRTDFVPTGQDITGETTPLTHQGPATVHDVEHQTTTTQRT
jgi:hypothetical protein